MQELVLQLEAAQGHSVTSKKALEELAAMRADMAARREENVQQVRRGRRGVCGGGLLAGAFGCGCASSA